MDAQQQQELVREQKNHNLSLLSALWIAGRYSTGLCPKKSRKLKAEFAPKLTDLQLDTQKLKTKGACLWKSRKLKSEFAAQLTELRSGAYGQKT